MPFGCYITDPYSDSGLARLRRWSVEPHVRVKVGFSCIIACLLSQGERCKAPVTPGVEGT